MKRIIKEEITLLFSIAKWIFLSICVGIVVGIATTVFIKFLEVGINHRNISPVKYYYFLPIARMVSIFLVKKFAPDAKGHGTEKVIESIHKKDGKMNIAIVPIKLMATIITIVFGGSAGKEGPSAQIGASLTSVLADLFKIKKDDRKKLVICGISAGFGAVFGTPIAGAIFAVEVLYVGLIMYEVLLPSFISAAVAFETARRLGINYHFFKIDYSFLKEFDIKIFIYTMIAGVVFALISFILIESLKYMEKVSEKLKISMYIKGASVGIILVLIATVFSDDYLGLGTQKIDAVLSGEAAAWYSPFLKIITTVLTLCFGGSGGIITPIFFIGTTAGSALGHLFGSNTVFFAALGLVAVLSGSANTPIAASIMAIELFGVEITPYATLACIISFLLTGHRSVFPTQILAMKKSQSLMVKLGVEVKDVQIEDISNKNYKQFVTGVEQINDKRLLKYLITEGNIVFLDCKNELEAIDILAKKSVARGYIEDNEKFKEEVINREKIMATATKYGVAMPHAESALINDFFIIVGISKTEINWEGTEQKVNVVYLIGKPDGEQKNYLRILSKIAKFVKEPDTVKRLINCKSEKEVIKLIK